MREFQGKAGRIFIEKAGYDDRKAYEVWFEDLCILGDGDSELDALNEAWRHTGDILALISEATLSVSAAPAVIPVSDQGVDLAAEMES